MLDGGIQRLLNTYEDWSLEQRWEIEDTLVYLGGIAAITYITLQQDGGQRNHKIFVIFQQ